MLMQALTVAKTAGAQVPKDTVNHVLLLVGIILLAGALGGLIHYFQSVESGAEKSSHRSMRRRIVIGVGAAFLVPLFLNMISSDLLLACKDTPTKLLVFAGFCLVAAISSSAFIRSMSDQLIEQATRKAEEATERVNEVKLDLEPIKAKATEPPGESSTESSNSAGYTAPTLTSPQKKVLRALCETGFVYRSVEGILEHTGIESAELMAILKSLVADGLVRQTSAEEGVRWCLTKQGREIDLSAQAGQRAEVIRLRQSENDQAASA